MRTNPSAHDHGTLRADRMEPRQERKIDGLSRRACLGGAALVFGIGATSLMATSAAAKTSQATAKYQDKPQGQSKCGTCSQFQAPNTCNLVDGTISENGWCQLYTPKA